MSLLKYNITQKGWVNKTTFQLKFEVNNKGKEYKVGRIWDSAVYVRESKSYLPGLYYLILWKSYLEEKNT